ncbi:MAG TPA: hypothetical protein VEV17_19520 [Bryobacteraceae bacterium]|nr:hypothetical protein [Bryobacteraceae bacterium]
MNLRFAATVTVLSVMALPAAGQPKGVAKETARSKTWVQPLTPDGQPDLQGVWLDKSATPLERPKALEGRSSLTDAEVAELRQRAARIFQRGGGSDYAAGDAVFLAALANSAEYKSPNSTSGAVEMIDRDFDNRTSLIVDPPDGKVPPLTPAARQRQAERPGALAAGLRPPARVEDLSSAIRCITAGVPRLGGRYGAGDFGYYEIVQAPGFVVLFSEVIHEARVIPLDGRPHLPQNIRSWDGDSRGRWEGKTLVVDTTNFSSKSNFMGSGENLHLVERFNRIAANEIQYQITVDDATTWTRPWTAMVRLKQSQEKIYEFACHEGNFPVLEDMLSAARANDKAQEDAQGRSK